MTDALWLTQASLYLTEGQHTDVLQLRRLFYAKLGALARERRALWAKAPAGAIESALHASSRLDEVVQIATELQDNSTQELRTHLQFDSAFYRGVSCTQLCSLQAQLPQQNRIVALSTGSAAWMSFMSNLNKWIVLGHMSQHAWCASIWCM